MPDAVPRLRPLMVTGAPWSPAAVLAVCEPWLLRSRGEWNSLAPGPLLRPPASKNRAPITLLLQVTRWVMSGSLPASQTPWNFAAMATASGRGSLSGAKLGLSGQQPVSRTPTMTPSPAWLTLPNCLFQTPLPPSRPRNLGVDTVSAVKMASFQTLSTPGVDLSRAASLV